LAETPRFALVATVVCLVVLTLTPAKQEHYVLPALVPAALLAGHVVVRAARVLPGGARPVVALLLVAAAAYAASRWVGARADLAAVDVAGPARYGAALVAAAGLLVVATPRLPVLASGAVLAAVVLGLGNVAEVARDGEAEDLRDAVHEAAHAPGGEGLHALVVEGPTRLPAGRTLVGFEEGAGEAFDTLVAWQDAPYARVRSLDALRARLDADPTCLVVLRAGSAPRFAPLMDRLRPLAPLAPRRPGSDRDRYYLYAAAP
ncbi:MAG: hypothetical protein JNM10_00445, partial [Planctomycetia bacterium]|nr:hypothetical protein [Planctomycetia bacterium]